MGVVSDAIIDIVMALISVVYGWIVKPFLDLETFENLIFGKDGEENLVFGIFTSEEIQNIYAPGIYTFATFAAFVLIIGIVLAGTKISSAGINPANRTYIIMFGLDLIVVAILLSNLSTIYSLIFDLNETIIKVFDYRPEDSGLKLTATLPEGEDILGKFIINLMVLGLALWGNWYYTMRKITLMIFLIMGPLMAIFYMIPRMKGITISWFKEFTGTVFIQSLHAMLYWIAALMTHTANSIESVILYLLFIPTAEMVRSLLGLGGGMNGKLAAAGSMLGMSALAGMYGAVKGAIGDKSVTGAIRGAYEGYRDKKSQDVDSEDNSGQVVAANTGTDTGTTSLAEKMLKPGEIGSKMGKAVAGMSGSIVGSPMGPYASIMAAHIGAEGGEKIGGLAGRLGAAGTQFVGNRLGKGVADGIQKAKDLWNGEGVNDEKLAKELAEAETNQWASKNREQFLNDMKERFPDLDQQSLDTMWNDKLSEQRSKFYQDAKKLVDNVRKNDGQFANASKLANASAEKLTEDWAQANQKAFMEQYDQNNPVRENMTSEELAQHKKEKEKAWNDTVAQKREQYQNIANKTASELSHGKSPEHAYIHKGDFAEKLAGKVLEHDKQAYIQNVRQSGSVDTSQLEVEFEDKFGGNKVYLQKARQAVSDVKGVQIYSGVNVNRDYLANQLAYAKTQDAKHTFLKTHEGNENAEVLWSQRESKEFAKHLQSAKTTLPEHIPVNQVQIPNGVLRGAAAIGAGVGSGVISAVGIKEVAASLQSVPMVDKGLRMVKDGAKQGASAFLSTYTKEDSSLPVKFLKGAKSSLVEGSRSSLATFVTPSVVENPVEKQEKFRNGIAYVGGVLGGVSGYQKAAKLAAKHNIFNKYANEQIAEVSQIEHMAQKVDVGNSEMVIASGAVQLVTTNNRSYVQVRDKAGQTRIVSRYGTGDSNLKQGEIVYQDLNIQDGALVKASSPYQLDSGGGKITLNRSLNINPSKLLINRNTSTTPVKFDQLQAYNQDVDSGQFYATDIITHTKNIRMRITHNRSYLVAEDSSGQEVRVSPYGKGDPRIGKDEVQEIHCTIRNNRIVKDTVKNIEINQHEFTTSLEPHELIPPKMNKRLAQRKEFEAMRHRSLGGTV